MPSKFPPVGTENNFFVIKISSHQFIGHTQKRMLIDSTEWLKINNTKII